MDSTVIVALPALDDPVMQVSSEKVPHLTLLYLGTSNVDESVIAQITDFLEHASLTSMRKFLLEIDHRGELGDNKADVLFLKDRETSDMERLQEFLHFLKSNEAIRDAYDSVEQYPKWTPHVTLGFPETPANETDRGTWPFITFDRIAFWTGDYDGPVFQLRDYDAVDVLQMAGLNLEPVTETEVPMTTSPGAIDILAQSGVNVRATEFNTAEKFLAHFGVKGMKWGFRRSDAQLSSGAPATSGKPSGNAIKGGVQVLGSNGKPLSGAARDAALRKALDGNTTAKTASGEAKVVPPPGLSADAARAAILAQQARELGLSTLSTKQLDELSGRLNAEKKYHTSLMDREKALADFNKKPPSAKQKAIDFALNVARDAAIAKATGQAPKNDVVRVVQGLMEQSKKRQADLAAQADLRSQAVKQEQLNRERFAPNGTRRSKSYAKNKKQSRVNARRQRDYYQSMGLTPDGDPVSNYRRVN